jgi:hypothetical protein
MSETMPLALSFSVSSGFELVALSSYTGGVTSSELESSLFANLG